MGDRNGVAYERKFKLLDKGYLKYKNHYGDDLTPLQAARMSTGHETGVDEAKDAGTRDYLIRHHHDTPMEMGDMLIEVKCPIFVAREIFRHRTFSYNEFSQRYSEAMNDYYLPAMDRFVSQSGVNKQGSDGLLDPVVASSIEYAMQCEQKSQRDNYESYLSMGLAREVARANMPVSNYTKFYMKGNLRNWFAFVNLRSRPNVQYECRVYSDAILEILADLWPLTTASWRENVYDAVTFSATEMKALRMHLEAYAGEYDLLQTEKACGLSGNKQREFHNKILTAHPNAMKGFF